MTGLVLPNLGLRASVGDAIKLRVRELMTDVLDDRVFHAEVVASGAFHFRRGFGREFGALFLANRGGCDHLANVVYQFFETQWRARYQTEGPPSYDGLSAGQFLDAVVIKSLPTPAEIEESWQLEIASSEDVMTRFYEGSARTRRGSDLGPRSTPLPRKH